MELTYGYDYGKRHRVLEYMYWSWFEGQYLDNKSTIFRSDISPLSGNCALLYYLTLSHANHDNFTCTWCLSWDIKLGWTHTNWRGEVNSKRKKNSSYRLQSISTNFSWSLIDMFRTSLQTSEVRCEVQKFIMKFTNHCVKLAFDWLLFNV